MQTVFDQTALKDFSELKMFNILKCVTYKQKIGYHLFAVYFVQPVHIFIPSHKKECGQTGLKPWKGEPRDR